MARRYWSLLRREIIVSWRNWYVAVVVGVALLYVAVIRLAIPAQGGLEPTLYVAYAADGDPAAAEALLESVAGAAERQAGGVEMLPSREALVEEMRANANSVGLVVGAGTPGGAHIELVFQGHEHPDVRDLLRLAIEDRLRAATGAAWAPVRVETLDEGPTTAVPLHRYVLPLFLVMEAALVGMFLICALVFMEKSEGTLRAYRVSPGGVAELLVAKVTVMVLLGLLFTAILTPAVMGFEGNYGHLTLLVVLGSVFASSAGLLIGSFFDNITQATVWLIGASAALAFPAFSYMLPAFSPLALRALPTYPLLFGIRDALFAGGCDASTFLVLAAWAVGALGLTVIVYRRRLAFE